MSTPSNPSPFSAELQTFIVTKYDPLLSIVKELNERLQNSEKERWHLECRVNQLERQLKMFAQAFESGVPAQEATSNVDEREDQENLKEKGVKKNVLGEELLSAPWLFSCKTGTSLSAMQVLLEFPPDRCEELDVALWNREEDMWIAFLENLPEGFFPKPTSILLMDLRKTAREVILELCKGEIFLLLRRVPGKLTASSNPMGITLVAIIVAAFSEGWQRVSAWAPVELGRIAVVMEGDNIGSRLRAGREKFQIEALN